MNHFSRFKINLISLIITIFLSTHLFGQEISFTVLNSSSEWENVLRSAENENKKVFLDIYAKWCGPCKMMDANVYTDSVVAGYYNENFINAKIDGETEFGMILARQYGLTAYPTMFFINSKKEPVFTVIGYRDPAALTSIGKQVIDKGERYMALNAKFDTGQISTDEHKEYLALLLDFGQQERYQKVVANTLNNLSEDGVFDTANKEMILKGGGDIDNKAVLVVIKNASHFRNAWGIEDFTKYLSGIYNTSMQIAIKEKDEVKIKRIAEILIPVYLSDSSEQIPSARLTTYKIYYSQISNWDRYIKSVEDFYTGLGGPVKKFFYNEVYYIIENQLYNDQMLLKALEWINREIAIQPDFESFFLGAIVNTYRKDYIQADLWMAKAEPLALTEDDKNSVKELKIYIGKLKNGTAGF